MLYHADVFWPKQVSKQLPFGVWTVVYSTHAYQQSFDDRYGEIPLLRELDLSNATVFEAEYDGRRVNKVVVRIPHDHRDIVLAANVNRDRTLYVRTVWFNLADDKHETLNHQKYVRRPLTAGTFSV